METPVVFFRYCLIGISILSILFYAMYFISGYFKAYVVFHTYLDGREIMINKELEIRIIKELNKKFPYKNSLTIKIDKINEIEDEILRTIKNEYEKEINNNIIEEKKI